MSASYKTRTLTIPAGGSIQTSRAADFVTCLYAQAPFLVSFGNGSDTEFEAGLTYTPPQGVNLLNLRNPTGSDNTVTLGFGNGSIQDSRLTLGGEIATRITAPDTLVTPAPVSCANGAVTSLAGANGNRAELVLVNDGAGKVYIGGTAAAAAGQGLPLASGQSMVLTTAAQVFARNDSGGAVLVCVAENVRGA